VLALLVGSAVVIAIVVAMRDARGQGRDGRRRRRRRAPTVTGSSHRSLTDGSPDDLDGAMG
jgi:hypothetical protein